MYQKMHKYQVFLNTKDTKKTIDQKTNIYQDLKQERLRTTALDHGKKRKYLFSDLPTKNAFSNSLSCFFNEVKEI